MRRCLGGWVTLLPCGPALVTWARPQSTGSASTAEENPSTGREAAVQAPYRRRSSDPRTLRERADFRRDHKYGRVRPLPDLPWRQQKAKTYLDDAERLYGRKETWHTTQDEALREKLVAILQDYLRDTTASASLEASDARRYRRRCEEGAQAYRASVRAGAFGSPDMLQSWAAEVLERRSGSGTASTRAASTPGAGDMGGEGSGEGDAASAVGDRTAKEGLSLAEEEELERRERRRRRGAQANLEGSVALADLPAGSDGRPSVSAFPFLRQRAIAGEHTLDPSLVDWTARYFPEDGEATFREPPQLRARTHPGPDSGDGSDGSNADSGGGGEPSHSGSREGSAERAGSGFGRPPRLHARNRLNRSLRAHEDRRRATFDAEGVFYHVRQQFDGDERAPRPRPVRGSEVSAPGARAAGGVVKVPWGVVSTAKQQGYTPDILRAKERLIRLSRGEDPETIP